MSDDKIMLGVICLLLIGIFVGFILTRGTYLTAITSNKSFAIDFSIYKCEKLTTYREHN